MIWRVQIRWWTTLVKADTVLADKAYDADERVRRKLKEKIREAVIPPKKKHLEPSNYDKWAMINKDRQ